MQKYQQNDPVDFFHFPGPKRNAEKHMQQIQACHHGDSFMCGKDSYICSIHFVGGNIPTKENPDPISATTSKELVS